MRDEAQRIANIAKLPYPKDILPAAEFIEIDISGRYTINFSLTPIATMQSSAKAFD
jgi:hypothetical protein